MVLSMDVKPLIEKALQARHNAYAPYSGLRVGACVRAASGRTYSGCNVENAAFGETCCAERVAIYTAVAAGEREFTHLAVASDGEAAFPCGACRQVIMEFAPDAQVVCADCTGAHEVHAIKDLLPRAFTFDPMKEGCGDA
jgi:cytidine deaminase